MDPKTNTSSPVEAPNGSDNGLPFDGDVSKPLPAEAPGAPPAPPSKTVDPAIAEAVEGVLYSDIGVTTLLNCLKQSIASAKDFATFLKKRSAVEDEHARELKKLCRITADNVASRESRGGSYARSFNEVNAIHEKMAENGSQFAISLHQMHEDIMDLSHNMERGRKQWKQTGLTAEKRFSDAETAMEKAKAKYDSLAEDYDGVRTGDKSVRHFGLRGPKSAAQQEESLLAKLQGADQDYNAKVQNAQSVRQTLVSTERPQAIKALQVLIAECDSALTLQLQKFAAFNEKLLLGNGILVSPLQDGEPKQRSLRDIIAQVDNDKDLNEHLLAEKSKVPHRKPEIKYEKHPTLTPVQHIPPSTNLLSQQQNQSPLTSQQSQPLITQFPVQQAPPPPQQQQQPPPQFPIPPAQQPSPMQQQPPPSRGGMGSSQGQPPYPVSNERPFGSGIPPVANSSKPPRSRDGELPPIRPVFGVNLDDLFRRDQSPVPMVVYQCIQAVDLFGLDVEGIYRIPGTSSHITRLKSLFDHDASKVDFRNPEAFFHDVNSVAGLCKQFFRDLPDPLLTTEHYGEFIDAARVEDETIRRDSVHAIINALPDPNYATLRALVLHLNRVAEHFQTNRMSTSNLAICFAPTLMGPHRGPLADAALQARVLDTILQNTYQIFDED
ncbi:RhoGAP-domain-containing protein [Aulographum hederae CBS 113979]|uniref:RhoGAP-domain-containing protein n=1 Tax=Aulographum hederae CBS 113979 TaxID=1176131 RepID=A0A6G1GJ34_9PEZI|nr:RhoGAP-domain-containing protein [Aulographum hederae CBS 113979]